MSVTDSPLRIGQRTFSSRLLVGTGKYPSADVAAGVRAPGGVHPAWHPAVLHPGSSVPAAGSPERDRPADAPATATDDDGAPSPASMPGRYPTAGYSPHNGSSAALRTRELPGCSLHVFRHVSKAAGTTVRFIFDKQVAMGEWEFAPMCHYGFREADWKETLRRFREAAVDPANVRDGSNRCADMAVHNVIGDAFRGATWVSLHNGGGVGWGEVINGGFGMVIDGSAEADRRIRQMIAWDVTNGLTRRAWARNPGAIWTVDRLMASEPLLSVTTPYQADPQILRNALKNKGKNGPK